MHSRQKGNRFELEIARLLSAWWEQPGSADLPAKDLWFRRVPLSGGFDKRLASDIWVVDARAKDFPFSVESKNREEWDWSGLFKLNEKWPVFSYWNQTVTAAEGMKQVPLLIFTKNRHLIYFCAYSTVVDRLLSVGQDKLRGAPTFLISFYENGVNKTLSFGLFRDLLKLSKHDVLNVVN